MKRPVEIQVSTSSIRFQTWNMDKAIEVLQKLYNLKVEHFTDFMYDYLHFVCSDSVKKIATYQMGEIEFVTIEFVR